ncbi:MAG: hypothetical protein JWO95_2917 [Verrucomicrobiales bacterium]|nr:hypothetical protein [Verrucomicrobiales bacterium]
MTALEISKRIKIRLHSPQASHAVVVENRIITDNRDVFHKALRRKNAIERVSMMERHPDYF